jgi:dodecin
MSDVVKVIELVRSSEQGWTEAAQTALHEASKTIKGITGLEVNDITAKVHPDSGKITQYRLGVKIAFKVEHS